MACQGYYSRSCWSSAKTPTPEQTLHLSARIRRPVPSSSTSVTKYVAHGETSVPAATETGSCSSACRLCESHETSTIRSELDTTHRALRCVHDSREAPLSVGTCRTYHISSGQPIVRTWRWCELHWRGGLCNASNYSILAVKQISQSQPEHSLPDEFRLGHGLDQSVQLKTSCFSFPGQECTSPEVGLQERTKGIYPLELGKGGLDESRET